MKALLPLLTIAFLVSCNSEKQGSAEMMPEEAPAAPNALPKAVDPAGIDVTKPESLIGAQLADAQEACEEKGIRCRVVEVNGESLPVTTDHDEHRLNFKIDGGMVISVTKG